MRVLFLSIVLLVIASCSKEQRTSRKLDGEWNAPRTRGKLRHFDARAVTLRQ